MAQLISKSSLRIIPGTFESKEEYLLYLRHVFAYEFAKENISKNSSVLEMGCGEGYGTSLMSEHVEKITGLDVDANAVDHAQNKYGSSNCTFTLYDGRKIPFRDNTFDAVISFQVIEHVEDDANFVAEIFRILKNNGIFIVTTPNRTLRLKPGQKPWNKFHLREYSPDQFEMLLKNKFEGATVWGIRGNDEVQRVESDRVAKSLKIASFDPLNLRRLVPGSLKQFFGKVLGKLKKMDHGAAGNADFAEKYSLNDYFVIKTDVSNSLDLLSILKKLPE
ncbi:MAG: class I SAM-dependent methyltransferase [bacterium]